jgi:hypothetical protein
MAPGTFLEMIIFYNMLYLAFSMVVRTKFAAALTDNEEIEDKMMEVIPMKRYAV